MDLKTIGSTEGRSPTPRLSHAHRAIAHTTLSTLHHQCPWTKYPPSPVFITASTILTHPRRRNPSIHPSCPHPASAEDSSACDDSATTDRFLTLGAAVAVRRSSTPPLLHQQNDSSVVVASVHRTFVHGFSQARQGLSVSRSRPSPTVVVCVTATVSSLAF